MGVAGFSPCGAPLVSPKTVRDAKEDG